MSKINLKTKNNNLSFDFLSAGSFWSDGGAAMGPLPKAIWKKKIPCDDLNRIAFPLNLLLIQDGNTNILVDTGIGNRVSEKEIKIFKISEWTLLAELEKFNLSRFDIDYVILTHLHFDHAGGIITNIENKTQLTFPNAKHVIQHKEWNIAKNPDGLNKAAYNFEKHLHLLADSANLMLVDGKEKITEHVSVIRLGGHTEGLQGVRIESAQDLAIYPGDIFPCEMHLSLPIISGYDVNRTQSYYSKKYIMEELTEKKGMLLLNHDSTKKIHYCK